MLSASRLFAYVHLGRRSGFESLILSHHPRRVTCECNEEDINDDNDDVHVCRRTANLGAPAGAPAVDLRDPWVFAAPAAARAAGLCPPAAPAISTRDFSLGFCTPFSVSCF